ncbi:MAG: hypothetical protein LBC70_06095 [Chitinispirillales bacterium]|jgi:hypothetical protein|nr:hypothetical protein [Chitinispirillales bacterium]
MGKKKEEYEDEDDLIETDEALTNKASAMVIWTKRSAFFLGFCAFIVMFMLSFDFENYLEARSFAIAMVKGFCAGLLFWTAGLIMGNIFLKGLIADIPVDQSHLVDGGVLQRVYLYQQRLNYDMDGNVIQVDPRTDTIVKKSVKSKKV